MQVYHIDNQLLADSREIATELGVIHKEWMRNIVRKYKDEIEQDFGMVRFENAPSVRASDNVITGTEPYALLTEDQATYVMTLSKNTDQVRQAKRNLVKSFSEAKRLLADTHHADKVAGLDWRRERTDLKSVHMIFQNACMSYGFPAAHVHDYITARLTGLTAEDARRLPLIEGEEIIGLNHQESPALLARIAHVKLQFATLKKRRGETYRDMADRAIVKA